MNKYQKWYEAQPQHIRDWYDQPRAIWYDADMAKAFFVGIIIGLVMGLAF